MQAIGQTISTWNDGPRPLKGLTKVELLDFPTAAPPDGEREWAFSKEVLNRVVAMAALERRARGAAAELDAARRFLDTTLLNALKARERLATATEAKDEAGAKEAQGLIQSMSRLEAGARARIATAEEAHRLLQAKLADTAKVDSVLSQAEVDRHYAGRYGAAWAEYPRKFSELNLFEAQSFGFGSFMACKKESRDRDMATFRKAEQLAYLAGQINSVAFKKMSALWQVRIAPTLDARGRFKDEDGEVRVANLKDEQKKQYWGWFKTYNTYTRGWGWPDDGGVAYDERNEA